jgi:hypothetical protein
LYNWIRERLLEVAPDYMSKEVKMTSDEYKLSDILPELTCSWKGCQRTIVGTDRLPVGWKYLVVSQGSLFVEDNLLEADLDGVICPEHSIYLRELLEVKDSWVRRSFHKL